MDIDFDLDSLDIKIPVAFRNDLRMVVSRLKKYGAREVFLFGSLTGDTWTNNSDIDIAITGIEPSRFFQVYVLAGRDLVHGLDLIDLDHEKSIASFLRETNRLVKIA